MVRKLIILLCIAFMFFGCKTNDVIQSNQNQLIKPTKDDFHDQLGYVHYTKEEVDREGEMDKTLSFNKKEMANIITKMILRNEGFNEVATLVSDQEVLIAFDYNERLTKGMAKDIAEKNAATVLPRHFNIYVSSNRFLIPNIKTLHEQQQEQKDRQFIEQIIEEMQKE